MSAAAPFNVLICGGGIAAAEALLRLRRLAGDGLRTTVIAPERELVYRPLTAREPFAPGSLRRYPLGRILANVGARWIRDRLRAVDPEARRVSTAGGRELPYDALLLAVGAGQEPPFRHGEVFSDRDAGRTFTRILRDVDHGLARSVAFVLPAGPIWPLPLYELALMTAARGRRLSHDLRLVFVTPEQTPLESFGETADEALLRLTAEARIDLRTGAPAEVRGPRELVVRGTRLTVDRIVTVPAVTALAVPGLPAGERGFLPVDRQCRVAGSEGRVFAAGDVTDSLVKHGGLAAQQADTAAAAIVHLAGASEPPVPPRPIIRGVLLTDGSPLYLAARLDGDGRWRSEFFTQPPWPADDKVVAAELGPYLRSALGSHGARR